jgi:hypothetical protein
MAGFVRVSGYSQADIDKAKAKKIGSYTGNQSINVSAYKRSGDTVNNFVIEVTSPSSAFTGFSDRLEDITAGASGFVPSKSLSGNTLSITASGSATISGRDAQGQSGQKASTSFSLTYNVWYIPS